MHQGVEGLRVVFSGYSTWKGYQQIRDWRISSHETPHNPSLIPSGLRAQGFTVLGRVGYLDIRID